jgi:hypothetical protein
MSHTLTRTFDLYLEGKKVDTHRIIAEEGISFTQLKNALLYDVLTNPSIPSVTSLSDAQNHYNDPRVKAGSPEANALIRAIAQYYLLDDAEPVTW